MDEGRTVADCSGPALSGGAAPRRGMNLASVGVEYAHRDGVRGSIAARRAIEPPHFDYPILSSVSRSLRSSDRYARGVQEGSRAAPDPNRTGT